MAAAFALDEGDGDRQHGIAQLFRESRRSFAASSRRFRVIRAPPESAPRFGSRRGQIDFRGERARSAVRRRTTVGIGPLPPVALVTINRCSFFNDQLAIFSCQPSNSPGDLGAPPRAQVVRCLPPRAPKCPATHDARPRGEGFSGERSIARASTAAGRLRYGLSNHGRIRIERGDEAGLPGPSRLIVSPAMHPGRRWRTFGVLHQSRSAEGAVLSSALRSAVAVPQPGSCRFAAGMQAHPFRRLHFLCHGLGFAFRSRLRSCESAALSLLLGELRDALLAQTRDHRIKIDSRADRTGWILLRESIFACTAAWSKRGQAAVIREFTARRCPQAGNGP